jgi:acyl-homoserine-lactone acylase
MPSERLRSLTIVTALVVLVAEPRFTSATNARSQSAATASSSSERAEILWDTYGVPHIFAKDDESLFHAFGWAQMANHANLLLRLYGAARGRSAEYFGTDENLASDRWVWKMGIPARARTWYEQQQPEFRRCLDAFTRGINAYADRHADRLDGDARRVLPVEATDVLAHLQRILHFTFVVGRDSVDGSARRWARPGSNAWAVAPSRSASGHALLLANPHLPWSDLFTFFESHLNAPGLNAYGAALVGQPLLGIAFNDRLGWTHTVNTFDGADLYELTLAGDGYRWDDGVEPFDTETHTLRIRRSDGTLGQESLVVKRSIHGPVVAEHGGKALALRIVGLDAPNVGEQYLQMMRATSLAEFEAAQRQLQMPMFTVIYADRDGHILHVFGGRTPIRPAGDYNWRGIVPGLSSATLWTGTHPYTELPRILDPASGWLQNANDPPWTTTFPAAIDANRYPPYLAPRRMSLRPQRSARMLDEDSSITFDEFIAYKHSTRMELADRILDDLARAVDANTSAEAKEAARVLAAWDRSADAGSRGAVLFSEFWRELIRRSAGASPFATQWSEASPRTTPDGLADPARAVAALEAAAALVKTARGSLDVPWGDVHRFRRDGVDLAANGAADGVGIFRVVEFEEAKDGKREAVAGDSYVVAVEFSSPVKAMALVGYGNASQPGSKHRTDQLPLLAAKKLRPVWLTRAEVERHLESRERFD